MENLFFTRFHLILFVTAIFICSSAVKAGDTPSAVSVELKSYKVKPTIFLDGKPTALPAYSAAPHKHLFHKGIKRFTVHPMQAYMVQLPRGKSTPGDWSPSPFWKGDEIAPYPLREIVSTTLDEQVETILAQDPAAVIIIRMGPSAPKDWRELHTDELFVTETGEQLPMESPASELYIQMALKYTKAVMEYTQSKPWSGRIIAYWNGLEGEGTHPSIIEGWSYDHSEIMKHKFRQYLRGKYGNVPALQASWRDNSVTFRNADPPRDPFRKSLPEVSDMLFFQPAANQQPRNDYLELRRFLFLDYWQRLAAAGAEALGERKCLLIYDAIKQPMQGWHNQGFFDPERSWPLAYHDMLSHSGSFNVTPMFDGLWNKKEVTGFDGIVTPYTYQARGPGGVSEPEGMADSAVLRGKYFLAELDQRTWTGAPWAKYFKARNIKEFDALTWRAFAASFTRGYNSYYMDLYTDWFADDKIQHTIARQREVILESVEWEHRTVPGIAMIIDDAAFLDTNGDGSYANEAIMWEWKSGLARCGVPFRIYVLEDLALENFPRHNVYYFPNMFRVTDKKMKLLQEKVFRNGNVVLWGPGSGISDGDTLSPEHAGKLTGFEFDWIPSNSQRRVQIHNYQHPITRYMDEGDILGGPLAYGPVLLPTDGDSLGAFWGKQGLNRSGLSVRVFGKGPLVNGEARGPGDWVSVFTAAIPIPANLWRGLADYAGAHIYIHSNDVLMADSSVVALHSIRSGEKVIHLPRTATVTDVITGKKVGANLEKIKLTMDAPETRIFRLQ